MINLFKLISEGSTRSNVVLVACHAPFSWLNMVNPNKAECLFGLFFRIELKSPTGITVTR